jgi:hypothetical protein
LLYRIRNCNTEVRIGLHDQGPIPGKARSSIFAIMHPVSCEDHAALQWARELKQLSLEAYHPVSSESTEAYVHSPCTPPWHGAFTNKLRGL